jgi:Isochorismatase family
MSSWDDKNFVDAIQKAGRKKIVLAGLWTETCGALPAVYAMHDGHESPYLHHQPSHESVAHV